LNELTHGDDGDLAEAGEDLEHLRDMASEAPVIRLVNVMIAQCDTNLYAIIEGKQPFHQFLPVPGTHLHNQHVPRGLQKLSRLLFHSGPEPFISDIHDEEHHEAQH
jgi:hypothetical protein